MPSRAQVQGMAGYGAAWLDFESVWAEDAGVSADVTPVDGGVMLTLNGTCWGVDVTFSPQRAGRLALLLQKAVVSAAVRGGEVDDAAD